MNKKRILVIILVCILFVICYLTINIKYDRLARYSYGTESERAIIEKELTDQEIEYIIEYSLQPAYFMDYIYCYRFNIYHVDLYKHFSSLFPQFTIDESVNIVEKLFLLNKANDDFYFSLLSHDETYITNILRSYL